MDCEGILGGEVPSKSHCQLLFRICGMQGGHTPVCPCQFESRPSLHDRDFFAELVKNEFKWNTNRTPLCLNEGNNYIHYILTCIIMYLLLLSPEIHQQMILAPSRPGSIHCSIDLVLNTTVRNFCKDALLKMMTVASWAPVLVRASWWIVLKKMNLSVWSLRTRWQSAEMSDYNDGGMVATGGQSRQGMAR